MSAFPGDAGPVGSELDSFGVRLLTAAPLRGSHHHGIRSCSQPLRPRAAPGVERETQFGIHRDAREVFSPDPGPDLLCGS